MRSFEEVRDLLSQKIALERKRLKSYGTKADDFNLANSIARYVMALRTDARHRELKRLHKYLIKQQINTGRKIPSYVAERLKATSQMSKAIEHMAEQTEKDRPWNYKKDRKDKKEHKHKHGHSGSSRSSKHRD